MHQTRYSWISALGSRDGAVLISAWFILLWSALTSWAQHAMFGLASGAPPIVNQMLLAAHALIFIGIAAMPVAALVIWKHGLPQIPRSLQGTTFGLVLIDVLTLTILYHAYAPASRLRTFVSFVSGMMLALLLVWLFYQRKERDWQGVLLGGMWLLLFGFAIMTLRWWWRDQQIAQPYRIGYTLLVGLLAIIPFALTPPPIRDRLCLAFQRLGRFSIALMTALVWALLAVRLIIGIAPTDSPTPLTQSLTFLEVTIVGLLILRLYETQPSNAVMLPEFPARRYRIGLALYIVLYLLIGLLLIPAWIGAVSLDGYTYLNAARNYAVGRFVVRGLWSPLMSWLMAPFIALGGHPQIVQRVGVVLNGLIWMLLSGLLAKRFQLKPLFQLGVIAAVGAFALRYSFWPLTPDPLAAMILTAYFALIISDQIFMLPLRFGLMVGALGALAYFAKYFNVGFAPVHMLMTSALFWLNGTPLARASKFFAAAFATFLIIIAPWVLLVSLRYGMPTASIAGLLNRANLNLERSRQIDNCVTNPFCPIPDDVLFPWEDPNPAVYMPYAWSPLDSWQSFQYAIWITSSNLWYFAQEQAIEAGGAIPLALMLLALSVFSVWGNAKQRTMRLWLIGTIALYVLGHATTNSGEFRYFYALIPLGFIAVYGWVQWAFEHLAATSVSTRTANVLQAALLAAPIILTTTRPSNYAPLIGIRNPADRCQEMDAVAIQPYLRAPMASSSGSTHQLSYYTQIRSFGVASGSAAEVNSMLREAGVKTYVVHADSELITPLLKNYHYTFAADIHYCDEDLVILYLP